MVELEFTKKPTSEEIEALTAGLSEYAQEKKGITLQAQSFGFFHRDFQGAILAGCNGVICYKTMFIDQLWVSKNLRGHGIGTQLMQKAETLAKDLDCQIIAINTMDWEAESFYKNLGFKIDFERPGYEKNSKMIFLSKAL